MNRAERRKLKKIKQNQVRLTPARLEAIKNEVTKNVTDRTFEDVIPLMLTYLMDNFHCKHKGLFKFMDWFDAQMGMVNDNPEIIYDYIQRVKDETGVVIRYTKE